MTFRRYSPDQVKISFGGIAITGYMDGTFVDAERNEDQYTMHVGSLGDVTRTRNLNKTGKVTITLMQHAPINELLQTKLSLDDLADIPPQPLQIKDLSNNMRVHASQAWITKPPKIERAKESAGIQWVFECANLEITTALPDLI